MNQAGTGRGSGEAGDDLARSVLEFLARRPSSACFVAEIRGALGGREADVTALEDALDRLTGTGQLFLQHNFCPDPHFQDEDLRVVALIDRDGTGGQEQAVTSAQRLWQQWLATVLGAHRCS